MSLRIEKYSRKRPFKRRQYHARIVNAENGKTIWRTSEGYNNRGERDAAVVVLDRELERAIIIDLDDPNSGDAEL